MNELCKTLRLAASVMLLPLVATAAVSAFQWSQRADLSLPASTASHTTPVVGSTIAPTARNHAVKLDRFGNFSGRVWAANSLTRSQIGAAYVDVFVLKNGKIMARTRTGSAGEFNFSNLQPGVYSFIARGNQALAVHAVRIVDHLDPSVSKIERFETVAITQNARQVHQIFRSSIQNNKTTVDENLLTPNPINVLSGNRFVLDANGDLHGRTLASVQVQDPFQMRIVILQDGKAIADTSTNAAGEFTIENLAPGHYDFVATGTGGHAAFGFEAVAAPSPFLKTGFQPTSIVEAAQVLQTPLASPLDGGPITQDNTDSSFVQDSPQGNSDSANGEGDGNSADGGGDGNSNGFSDGGFSGGGAGGGFGNASFMSGVTPSQFFAAFGASFAIVAVSDNNNTSTPPPNSPNN